MKRNNRFLFHSILCAIWLVIACRHHRRPSPSSQSPYTFYHLIRFDVDDGCSGVAQGHSIATVSSVRRIGRREKYSIIQLITITNNCTIFHLHSHSTPSSCNALSIEAAQRLAKRSDIVFWIFRCFDTIYMVRNSGFFGRTELLLHHHKTLARPVVNANGSAANCARGQ